MYILYFDGGTLLNNSDKIRNWGKWSDMLDVRLANIDFVVQVRLQSILSVKVEGKEILMVKIIGGDRKLEDSVSRKLQASSDDSYLSMSMLVTQ